MYHFGLNLGITFQIIDDILDYSSNRIAIGKNIGDDFREAKVTLPIILAYSLSNQEEQNFWTRTIEQKDQKADDFSKALTIINKYQVIEKCLSIAQEFIIEAKNHLNETPESSIKLALFNLLNFSLNREF